MKKITQLGSYLFTIAILGFGIIQLITANLPSEFLPLPQNMIGKNVLALTTGIFFITASLGIILNKSAKLLAIIIGLLFLLFLALIHIPKLTSNIYNPSEWVAFLETLSFSCGAFILASILPTTSSFLLKWESNSSKIIKVTVYLFAVALLIFGVQHIMYEQFIITLIPGWIPFKILFSHLVKFAFIATSISIILNWKQQLSTFLLGSMFLIWSLILHAPRVASTPKLEPEWTSLFVALAMSGICFIISGYKGKQ